MAQTNNKDSVIPFADDGKATSAPESFLQSDKQRYLQQKVQIEANIAQLKQKKQAIDQQLDNAHAVLNGTIGIINYLTSKLDPGK